MNYSCFEGLVGSFKALQGKKTVLVIYLSCCVIISLGQCVYVTLLELFGSLEYCIRNSFTVSSIKSIVFNPMMILTDFLIFYLFLFLV